MSFPIKLDGNDTHRGQSPTGQKHICSWECRSEQTEECRRNDDDRWEEIKSETILKAKEDYSLPNKTKHYYDIELATYILKDLGQLEIVKKHRGYELGAREFTLTYTPKWMDDVDARRQMGIAIDRLIKYYDGQIIELRAVGEVGTNGLSHIHCFYKLKGGLKITDKNFKRAWKYWNPKKVLGWGFEGGHHATVKNESDFRGYIEKDIDSAWMDRTVVEENNPSNNT